MASYLLAVGSRYPLPVAGQEGAAAHFLGQSGNVLQIALPNLSSTEEKIIRKGEMRMGLVIDQPLLLFVVAFYFKKEDPIILECPFDARLVPKDELRLDDVTDKEQRLLLEVHLVDSASGLLKGLRGITMAPGLTRDFLVAVQDQLVHTSDIAPVLAKYVNAPLEALPSLTQMYPCGK